MQRTYVIDLSTDTKNLQVTTDLEGNILEEKNIDIFSHRLRDDIVVLESKNFTLPFQKSIFSVVVSITIYLSLFIVTKINNVLQLFKII